MTINFWYYWSTCINFFVDTAGLPPDQAGDHACYEIVEVPALWPLRQYP